MRPWLRAAWTGWSAPSGHGRDRVSAPRYADLPLPRLGFGEVRFRMRLKASIAVSSASGRVCPGDVGYWNCLNAWRYGLVRRLTSAA